jgi:hypothetical protein
MIVADPPSDQHTTAAVIALPLVNDGVKGMRVRMEVEEERRDAISLVGVGEA